jgi:hypothetical protein
MTMNSGEKGLKDMTAKEIYKGTFTRNKQHHMLIQRRFGPV